MVDEMKDFVTEFEENMNAITEIEDAMKQEAVNTLVEEGMMHVNFLTKAYFDGKVSTKFNIKNIENNHDDIVFEIFDEDGESLYKSKKIAPGYEMNCIELNRELAIYVGNGKVVEAKNESAGVVYGDIPNPECIVTIGRP